MYSEGLYFRQTGLAWLSTGQVSVEVRDVDPHPVDADPDSTYHPDADSYFLSDGDPDTTFRLDADPDSDPSFKKTRLKALKKF